MTKNFLLQEFSDDEFRAYQAQRQREIEGLINQGQVPPGYPYFGNVPPGAMPYELPHQGGAYGQGGVPGSIPGQPAFRQDPASFQQHPNQQQPQFGGQPPMGAAHPQMGGQQPQMGRQQFQQPPPPQQFQGQPQQFQGQPQQFQGNKQFQFHKKI